MSKSVYVVGGIGVIGCLMLSFMMQHLLKVKTDRSRSPVAIELEEACAQYLDGPIEAATFEIDGERTTLLRLRVFAGVDADRLARSAGDLVWRRAHKFRDMPERLRFEVRGPGLEQPLVVDSRPQGLDRLSRHRSTPAGDAAPTGSTPPK
ncbi:MAG: hypothetical protein AB7O97_03145 [Planctomycetota bacterium]